MSVLIIATNNAGKVKEIRAIFGGVYDKVYSLREAGLTLDVEEDGVTFEQNAVKKATHAANVSGCDALADDSGLCVNALGGAPGVYSARYAGAHATDALNNEKLLAALENEQDRGARFVCVVALVKGEDVVTASGEASGEIARRPSGGGGFGYDPLFFCPNTDKPSRSCPLRSKTASATAHRRCLR